jgi:uncharacterized membrane protein
VTHHSEDERLPDVPDPAVTGGSPLVRAVQALEASPAADGVSAWLARLAGPVTDPLPVRHLLQGRGAGHAVHPPLTDVPLGLWTATVFLDLAGGRSARPAARRLLAAGIVSAVPTALTGLAEWRETSLPERRVGAVHALLNSAALGLYAVSYAARARDRHRAGVMASLAATSVATVSGYLGGHLAVARKVGTRDAAYGTDGVGPVLRRPASGPGEAAPPYP